MSLDSLPINAFDLLLVVVIVVGFMTGRKHGMSEELLKLGMWLAIVFACAIAYEPLGTWLAGVSLFSLLSSFLMAYIGIGVVVFVIAALIKQYFGGKILGSDLFGRAEYYLGMGGGVIRALCVLVVGLALLNAHLYTPEEIKARESYQNEWYGSDFFPGLQSMQATVFERSLTGPWIKNNLGFFLIKPTKAENKQLHQKDYQFP
jgi:uncharacterized membrane protein required for colicin V production